MGARMGRAEAPAQRLRVLASRQVRTLSPPVTAGCTSMGIFKKSVPTKPAWERVPWDGNPELGYECWRKRFGRGHVSVGIGEFTLVCYSYGPNSDDSISSTRWHYDTYISEQDMMDWVDKNGGKCKNYPVDPELYRGWWESMTQEVKDAILSVGRPWHESCKRIHECHMTGIDPFPMRG